MFRAVKVSLAPLASLKPVLAASVAYDNSVKRFTGVISSHVRVPDVRAVHSVVEKTKGEGLVGAAAIVVRAGLYLGSHNSHATIEEINATLPKIQDEAVKRAAIGVRLRARNALLDLKEAALNVSGGATEAEVSELRSQVMQDYEALVKSSPNCWLTKLGAAEFNLYVGNTAQALKQLTEIEERAKNYVASPIVVSDAVATAENTNLNCLVGFQLQRAYFTRMVKPKVTNKCVEEGIASVAEDPAALAALTEFKKTLNVELSDAEALEVAFSLYSANVRHHYSDYFPPVAASPYDYWASPKATIVGDMINEVYHPASSHLQPGTLEKVRSAPAPHQAFYAPTDKLREALKSAPKDQSILASIRSAFGTGPQSALSSSDEALTEAMEALTASVASQDTAGTTRYAQRQSEIAHALGRQILYRTQVQKAVALTELNRLHEAVETVTPVIAADEYLHMWRAFLARSRAYKGLGLITHANKDVNVLKTIKKSLTDRHPHELI